MALNSIDEIYLALRRDDMRKFSELVGNRTQLFSLCFGRFPLLSVCYLFGSVKILFKYEKKLLKITNYTVVNEYEGIYKEFKSRAGKCLRFYVYQHSIVEPAQMLAILGMDDKLERISRKCSLSQTNAERVCDIYRINDCIDAHYANDGAVLVDSRPLSTKQLAILLIAAVLILAITALSLSAIFAVGGRYGGDGKSVGESILISTQQQFNTAIYDNAYAGSYFKLNSNLILPDNWTITDFDGHLDGNGHTLYVNDPDFEGLFETMSGTIKNVNISLVTQSKNLLSDFALLARENRGSISNVSISVEGVYTELANENDTEYFGLLVAHNLGRIENCYVNTNLKINGDAEKNYYFAAIAGINGRILTDENGNNTSYISGTIIGCVVSEHSTILLDSVDAAAIAAANCSGSQIIGCTNNAEITQTSASVSWSPNTAGIVCTSYGSVSECANNGAITSISTASDAQATNSAAVYSAGIACTSGGAISDCINNGNILSQASDVNRKREVFCAGIVSTNDSGGTVQRCKSDATVKGLSSDYFVYVGGITAQNGGTVAASGSSGSVIAQSESIANTSTYVFAAGINGANYATTINCFSYATISAIVNESEEIEENAPINVGFAGGINGLTSYASTINGCYYLTQDGVTFGSAAVLMASTIYNGTNSGTTAVDTLDELKATGVYW